MPSTNHPLIEDPFQSTISIAITVFLRQFSTVPNVDDVKGMAVSPATGKLYVAYRTPSGVGMIYCLSIHRDAGPVE